MYGVSLRMLECPVRTWGMYSAVLFRLQTIEDLIFQGLQAAVLKVHTSYVSITEYIGNSITEYTRKELRQGYLGSV